MALNASGPISLAGSTAGQSIAVELGLSATGQISLNDAAVRGLAGVASGAIVMPTDFYGKSSVPKGRLYTWGNNPDGALGNGTRSFSTSPVQVGALATWYSWAFGQRHALGIQEGKLFVAGYNYFGELGLGNRGATPRSSPTQVGALTNWKYASGGSSNSLAVKQDGTLWSWGFGNNGGLGQGDTVNRSSPTQVGALTNWETVTNSVSTQRNALALKTDGTMWSWGSNDNGVLGITSVAVGVAISSPQQIGSLTTWAAIGLMYQSACAVSTNGTAWTWGRNGSGELGQNDRTSRSSPVQLGALTNWKTPANSKLCFGTMVVKTDGTMWVFGRGSYGNFGINLEGTIYRSSPVQVGVNTDWKYSTLCSNMTWAIKTNGTAWFSGANEAANGGAGGPANYRRSSFVQLGALTTWRKIWMGGANSTSNPGASGTFDE